MSYLTMYPDSGELFDFFCADPFFTDRQKGQFAYEVSDGTGFAVVFSFSVVEGWVQTVVKFNARVVSKVLSEGATKIWVSRGGQQALYAQASFENATIELKLMFDPELSVEWSVLEN